MDKWKIKKGTKFPVDKDAKSRSQIEDELSEKVAGIDRRTLNKISDPKIRDYAGTDTDKFEQKKRFLKKAKIELREMTWE